MDSLHHVALTVKNLQRAIEFYTQNFDCRVSYQDDTWAMLEFANISLALVVPEEHPSHIAFTRENADEFGDLVQHRDGVRSVYIEDSEQNSIEIIDKKSLKPD